MKNKLSSRAQVLKSSWNFNPSADRIQALFHRCLPHPSLFLPEICTVRSCLHSHNPTPRIRESKAYSKWRGEWAAELSHHFYISMLYIPPLDLLKLPVGAWFKNANCASFSVVKPPVRACGQGTLLNKNEFEIRFKKKKKRLWRRCWIEIPVWSGLWSCWF